MQIDFLLYIPFHLFLRVTIPVSKTRRDGIQEKAASEKCMMSSWHLNCEKDLGLSENALVWYGQSGYIHHLQTFSCHLVFLWIFNSIKAHIDVWALSRTEAPRFGWIPRLQEDCQAEGDRNPPFISWNTLALTASASGAKNPVVVPGKSVWRWKRFYKRLKAWRCWITPMSSRQALMDLMVLRNPVGLLLPSPADHSVWQLRSLSENITHGWCRSMNTLKTKKVSLRSWSLMLGHQASWFFAISTLLTYCI